MGPGPALAQNHGGASAYRSDGEVNRKSGGNENQRRTLVERLEMTPPRAANDEARTTPAANDEARMTNDEGNANVRMTQLGEAHQRGSSDLVNHSTFDIRHSSL